MVRSIFTPHHLRDTSSPSNDPTDDEKKKEIEAQDSEDGPDDIQEPRVIKYE